MNKIVIVTRKDLDVSYFVGRGAGGQNKQKNATGCQILHRASGAIGRCSETRSQTDNRERAFRRMAATPKFKFWMARVLHELATGETIEQAVQKSMAPENLVVQVRGNNGWEAV